VNLARAALVRTRANREATAAARAVTLGELKQLLMLQDEMSLEGELTTALDDPELALQRSALERRPRRHLYAARATGLLPAGARVASEKSPAPKKPRRHLDRSHYPWWEYSE
jgi:hypothetical protein